MITNQSDVLIVGGGPAGSTTAALLAERGESVVVVEKDTHPRFHIGESLLPLNLPLFEELGVKEAIDRVGMTKYGVEFVSPWHDTTTMLDFAQAWDKNLFYAYQVRRSEFDQILWNNAAAKGAHVVEGCRIATVEFPPEGGVVATGEDSDGQPRRFVAKFLVDASGRDTLLAGRLAIKQRNRRHASAAVFAHFTGARRLTGKAEGNISIFWFDHGWFWFIPLADGTTSVGAVCSPEFMKSRKTDVTSFLQSLIAQCPALSERLADAQMTGPATATGNYSYRAERMAGKNFIMVGDSYAFIDPVFSTGVYLAMKSAFLAVEPVLASLHRPGAEADRALRRFEAEVNDALATFSWYIYRVNTPAMRDLFMNPRNYFRMREAVLSLLSGDVFDSSPIHSRLLLFKGVYYIKSFFIRQAHRFAALSSVRSREA
ncbi:MAG: NAD(P)/FAD-dependent oxidoreductase [Acetobacteraceae bacterium]|jgi:flavin-dependent dehydrogenase